MGGRFVRFGVHLAASGPGANAERIGRLSIEAEAMGFDSVWVGDHVVMPELSRSAYPYGDPGSFTVEGARTFYEPIVTLAWVAARTSHIRLGISVLVLPQRNPLLTAKQLATLDDLSGGRLDLGVGVGWMREEFEALHARFHSRGEATDTAIRLMRRLWSGEPVRSTDPLYRFREVSSRPVPAQGTGIPIWVGGHSQRALRRTIELGDAWHAIRVDVEDFRDGAERLRAMAVASGKPMPALTTICELRLGGEASPADWRLDGHPDAVQAKLRRFAAAGCAEMILSLPRESTTAMVEMMASFASSIRPSVDG
jgi:probable F420-dependent oxidoreductase